jgi:adenylate cyclase
MALEKLVKFNAERVSARMAEIDCEIVLDAGSLMYGKVGSARRLDFTVMGPTLNEVVRLETLCCAFLG